MSGEGKGWEEARFDGVFSCVVATTALTASIGHAGRFAQGDHSELRTILSLLFFTVPGVIAGGQIGSAVARYIPQRTMMVGMGILFILVAGLMLGEVILNVR